MTDESQKRDETRVSPCERFYFPLCSNTIKTYKFEWIYTFLYTAQAGKQVWTDRWIKSQVRLQNIRKVYPDEGVDIESKK